MLEFGDSAYYLDLKAFDTFITLNQKNSSVTDKETKETFDSEGKLVSSEVITKISQNKEIDAAKYEIMKTLVEFVIDSTEDMDDSLGADRALEGTTLAYKIVFNTLLTEGIIKEK